MFMFVIYTLLLYISSIGLSFFIKEESKVYKLKNIIGFLILLSILQIGYYPMQYLKLSSNFFHIWTLIVILISFALGIKHGKAKDYSFLKSYEFWIILFLIFIVLKIIPGTEAGDDWFYMSLFKDNANINSVNTINPRVGLIGKVDSVYLYQGFYPLMSFLYKIQSMLFSGNLNNIFISYRSTMSLISCIYFSQIYIYLRSLYKSSKNKIFYIVELLSILLIGTLELMHIYWGSFFIFPICISLYIILFNLYIKDDKYKYKYLLFIVNMASISLASSALFLLPIIAFGYFVYELYKKKVNCINYMFIFIPSFIYIAFLFNKLWLLIPVLILYLIIFKFKNVINKVVNKYLIYILPLIPIIFIILGCMGDYVFRLEYYRVSKTMLLFNVIITLYTIYLLIKKERINPVLFVVSVTTIFFFNPLVQPVVSHKLTSTYTYYRLFYITKNPALIIILFMEVYKFISKFKFKKMFKAGYIVCMSVLVVYYGYHFINNTILSNNYDIKYNYVLREDNYSKQLGEKVSKLPNNSKVFSIYFAPRIYNSKLETTTIRYPDAKEDLIAKNFLVRSLYKEKIMNEEDYNILLYDTKRLNYDYYITYNNDYVLNRLKKEDFTINYKNDMFVLIKINK